MPGPICSSDPRNHYDYQAQVCGGEHEPTASKLASSTVAAPERRSAATEKLVKHARSKAKAKAKARESQLCRERKNTNTYLCGVLGSVAAGRLVPGTSVGKLTGANLSIVLSGACKGTFDWLEENAPGGACGKK